MDFFAILQAFFTQYGYFAVFGALIVCGFGVPIPEDVTLVCAGIISGLGYTNTHIMVAVGMAGVLVGDGAIFMLGKKYGEKALRFRPIKRLITPKRFATMQQKFEKYGNWVLFLARFMPGIRTAVFVTAGASKKVSFWQWFSMDGLAALISVPLWVYLGEFGARNIDWLKAMVHRFQIGIFTVLGLVVVGVLVTWLRNRKKNSQEDNNG